VQTQQNCRKETTAPLQRILEISQPVASTHLNALNGILMARTIRVADYQIAASREQIEAFCLRHHIRKLSLFGSVLTPRFRSESDLDVLVEFEPGRVPGYFRLVGMEIELSDMLGRKVDLRTPGELSRYFRDEVLASATVQYERQ
jgi:predicted nucleotidyltransferase